MKRGMRYGCFTTSMARFLRLAYLFFSLFCIYLFALAVILLGLAWFGLGWFGWLFSLMA